MVVLIVLNVLLWLLFRWLDIQMFLRLALCKGLVLVLSDSFWGGNKSEEARGFQDFVLDCDCGVLHIP